MLLSAQHHRLTAHADASSVPSTPARERAVAFIPPLSAQMFATAARTSAYAMRGAPEFAAATSDAAAAASHYFSRARADAATRYGAAPDGARRR